jgi:hypothetical protein
MRNKSEIVDNKCYECHKHNNRLFFLKCYNTIHDGIDYGYCKYNKWQAGEIENKSKLDEAKEKIKQQPKIDDNTIADLKYIVSDKCPCNCIAMAKKLLDYFGVK